MSLGSQSIIETDDISTTETTRRPSILRSIVRLHVTDTPRGFHREPLCIPLQNTAFWEDWTITFPLTVHNKIAFHGHLEIFFWCLTS